MAHEAAAPARDCRDAQRGRVEIDPLLLEWLLALELCPDDGGFQDFVRSSCSEPEENALQVEHRLSQVIPVVIDDIRAGASSGTSFTDLRTALQDHVPRATLDEGARVLREHLGTESATKDRTVRGIVHDVLTRTVVDVPVVVGQNRGDGKRDSWKSFEMVDWRCSIRS